MRLGSLRASVGVGLLLALGTSAPAGARAGITIAPGAETTSSDIAVVVEEDTNRISVFEVGSHDAVLLARFGGRGSEPGRFSRPYGAVVVGGTIWVTDRLNSRIQAFDARGRFSHALGLVAPPGGKPPEPGAPALDRDGHLIIPDLANDQLIVLATSGKVIDRWGRPGRAAGEFMQPVAAAVSPVDGRVYTVEAFEPRVQMFEPSGAYVGELTGSRSLELVKPTKVAVDRRGRVYVADEALNRVVRFDAGESIDLAWGGYGSGPGTLFLPEGLAVDAMERLWVVDHGNHRGQVFSDQGEPLFVFAAGEIGVVPGSLEVRASAAGSSERVGPRQLAVLATVAMTGVLAHLMSFRRTRP